MTLPQALSEELVKNPIHFQDGRVLALDAQCDGAKFHSPNPVVLKQFAVAGKEVYLCGTCEAKLQVFVSLMVRHDGKMPWKVRREFGNQLRAIGQRRWEETMSFGKPNG